MDNNKYPRVEKFISIAMLLFAIGFNLWLYRLEPTATVDPNDNAFQYALVDRTNQIWDFAAKKCSINVLCFTSYLVDHWVPNWAEGYNLPFYYGHVPQILIVGSYRLLHVSISLFTYYHWVIYLLLSFFPLSVFLALRVIKLPWLAAGIGALLASHISTDGLYGLDPPSFLWRGYGLSSQLFAMVFLPLALAYSVRFFSNQESGIRNQAGKKSKGFLFAMIHDSNFLLPVIFITATAMGHLGLGIIAMLSLVPLSFAKLTKQTVVKFFLLSGTVIFFLSYWVIPIFLNDNYHNISFWDPPWKFASYGAKEVMTRLLNGDLFDWGRGPWMTVLVIVGLIGAAWPKRGESGISNQESWNKKRNTAPPLIHDSYFMIPVLFLFWLLLYFGRTTWGPLIDLIPGMKEFHLSRFIVGVHVAGLFLMPIGVWWIIERIRFPHPILRYLCYLGILGLVIPPIYKQTVSYSTHNDRLIKQANENHAKVKSDEEALFAAIGALPPGRVFAGRGGSWGKDFKVAETPYYMQLSTFGIPTVLWLPQTWSPNSDVEQYFSEDKAKDYDLFGIRYVAAPPKQEPQKFWKLIKEAPTWKLYEIEKVRYFTTGVRPAVVATDKRSYGNVVRLWIQSDAHKNGLFPELTFAKDYPRTTGLPNFKMLDEVTYKVPDGSTHNLFTEPPVYMSDTKPDIKIISESQEADMIFTTKVDVPEQCTECIVVLKQSFHPNWRATIDGKPASTFTVFPFYLATLVPTGTHEVVFSYEPSRLKITLLILEIIVLVSLLTNAIRTRMNQ